MYFQCIMSMQACHASVLQNECKLMVPAIKSSIARPHRCSQVVSVAVKATQTWHTLRNICNAKVCAECSLWTGLPAETSTCWTVEASWTKLWSHSVGTVKACRTCATLSILSGVSISSRSTRCGCASAYWTVVTDGTDIASDTVCRSMSGSIFAAVKSSTAVAIWPSETRRWAV